MCRSVKHTQTAKRAAIVSMALATTLFAGCSLFGPRNAVPISSITNAAESGESSTQILTAMKTARTTYALRGSDFAKLAERDVPEPVLDELQQRFFGDVDWLTRRWVTIRIAGGPAVFYPQPVDLDSLDQGGDGMAPTTNVGRFTDSNRPPGVPDWVPARPVSPFKPKISVNDVVKMTEEGEPTPQIVATIRDSHIYPIYADPGPVVSRHRTAAITGSTYASLADKGVAPEVLDALQEAYLADHVEQTRLRWRDTKGVYRN
jgi:hypothetical protein